MVVIRLSRGGAKKRPFYRVVVADGRAARDGRYLARVGYFNPIAAGGEKRLDLNLELVEAWISKGAQPSLRVVSLLKELKSPELLEKRKAKKDSRKEARKAKKAAEAEASSAEVEASQAASA
jgi:ribosomal protein S16